MDYSIIPATILALATLIQGILNGRKSNSIIQKTEVIHDLTNSNLTAVKADLAEAKLRINDLQLLLLQLTKKDQ